MRLLSGSMFVFGSVNSFDDPTAASTRHEMVQSVPCSVRSHVRPRDGLLGPPQRRHGPLDPFEPFKQFRGMEHETIFNHVQSSPPQPGHTGQIRSSTRITDPHGSGGRMDAGWAIGSLRTPRTGRPCSRWGDGVVVTDCGSDRWS